MTVKTAVSLDSDLFEKAEETAAQLNVSRSRLIGMALREFLGRRRSGTMLQQLNEAYADASVDETPEASAMRRRWHRRIVEGSW